MKIVREQNNEFDEFILTIMNFNIVLYLLPEFEATLKSSYFCSLSNLF